MNANDTSINADHSDDEAERLLGNGEQKYQSSVVTVFSIWNTMLGTGLLALPWGFANSGVATGVAVVLVLAAISWYTAYLVLKNGKNDFKDVCEKYMGRTGKMLAVLGSCVTFFGVSIVYAILLSSNLSAVVQGIVARASDSSEGSTPWFLSDSFFCVVTAAVILPLSSITEMDAIVKLNSFGFVLVLYVISFIFVTSGVNFDVHAERELLFSPNFVYLAGVLALGFFIHNYVLTVARRTDPKTTLRDVSLGFAGGTASYLAIGVVGYIAFGNSILAHQNFLDVVSDTDVYGMTGRAAVVLQMLTLYPLIVGLLREQVAGLIFKEQRYGWRFALTFSTILVAVGTLFGIYYPEIGDVIRITGALCGFIYIFFLPLAVQTIKERRDGRGTSKITVAFRCVLLLIGILILIFQFF